MCEPINDQDTSDIKVTSITLNYSNLSEIVRGRDNEGRPLEEVTFKQRIKC